MTMHRLEDLQKEMHQHEVQWHRAVEAMVGRGTEAFLKGLMALEAGSNAIKEMHMHQLSIVAARGPILVGTRPQRGRRGPLRTPKLLHGTMCFVGARGAGDFV